MSDPMNQPARPHDPGVPPGDIPPKKGSGALLWILLLIAVLALGWYLLSKRDAVTPPAEPVAPIGETATVPSESPVSTTPADRQARAERDRRPAVPADREPRPLNQPEPQYPAAALRAREEGSVLVRADIDVNGDPSNVEVVTSSRNRELDRAAVAAVRTWKFEPAIRGGKPAASSVQVPVDFTLQNQ